MKIEELCRGKVDPVEYEIVGKVMKIHLLSAPLREVWDSCPSQQENVHTIKGLKRKKIKCLDCGRRVEVSVGNDHDGDVYIYLPPHKPKNWWRKNKKSKK